MNGVRTGFSPDGFESSDAEEDAPWCSLSRAVRRRERDAPHCACAETRPREARKATIGNDWELEAAEMGCFVDRAVSGHARIEVDGGDGDLVRAGGVPESRQDVLHVAQGRWHGREGDWRRAGDGGGRCQEA